jgi:hypothetical protein
MGARTDFWLLVHNLAQALLAEGDSLEERRAEITAAFRDMPPVVQREVLIDYRRIIVELPAAAPSLSDAAAVNETDAN